MTVLDVLRPNEPTAWFAEWILADPPPGLEVTMPEQRRDDGCPQIRIAGTVVKRDGKVWVLTGRKWTSYWEGKWPD